MARMVTLDEIQARLAKMTGTLADEWKVVSKKGPVDYVFENAKTSDRYESKETGFDAVKINPVKKA